MIIQSKGGGRPGLMPEGTHRAKVARISSKEGSPTLMFVFAGLDGDALNTECADFVNVEAAEWRLRLIYEASLGQRYPGIGQSFDTSIMVDREVMVECEHRENPNSGEVQARAGKIYPIG